MAKDRTPTAADARRKPLAAAHLFAALSTSLEKS